MIALGIAEGAKLVCGGPGRPEGLSRGYFARPTVFSEVRPDMAIAQEEIFGPVLVIIPYDTVDEAVAIANDTVYGLGAHVQGKDMAQARAVARPASAAGRCISTIRPGIRRRPSAATSNRAMAANTACSGWKSSSRPRRYWAMATPPDGLG